MRELASILSDDFITFGSQFPECRSKLLSMLFGSKIERVTNLLCCLKAHPNPIETWRIVDALRSIRNREVLQPQSESYQMPNDFYETEEETNRNRLVFEYERRKLLKLFPPTSNDTKLSLQVLSLTQDGNHIK